MNVENIAEQITKTMKSLLAALNKSGLESSIKMGLLVETLRMAHATFREKEIDAKDFHGKINSCINDNFPSNPDGEKSCTSSTDTIQ
jgi:hypothetical protein